MFLSAVLSSLLLINCVSGCDVSFIPDQDTLLLTPGQNVSVICDSRCLAQDGGQEVNWSRDTPARNDARKLYSVSSPEHLVSQLTFHLAEPAMAGTYSCYVLLQDNTLYRKLLQVLFQDVNRQDGILQTEDTTKQRDFNGLRSRRSVYRHDCPRGLKPSNYWQFPGCRRHQHGWSSYELKSQVRRQKTTNPVPRKWRTVSPQRKQSSQPITVTVPEQSSGQTTSTTPKVTKRQASDHLLQTTSTTPKVTNRQASSQGDDEDEIVASGLHNGDMSEETVDLPKPNGNFTLDETEQHVPLKIENEVPVVDVDDMEQRNTNLTAEYEMTNDNNDDGNIVDTVPKSQQQVKQIAGAPVHESTVALSDVIARLLKLEVQNSEYAESVKNMNSEMTNLKKELLAMKQKCDDYEDDLRRLRQQTQDPKSLFQVSLNATFVPSAVYQGRRYWLTRRSHNIGVSDAQAMCQRYGGYLAEMDSKEEFTFVRHFIMNTLRSPKSSLYVVTGGTDGIKEGEWVNRYGLTTMTELNWAYGEPNNQNNEDCQCFIKAKNWLMNDCSCTFYVNETGFLCEIPE